jgi:RNA polymerase sigma factor (sigma-70 family)
MYAHPEIHGHLARQRQVDLVRRPRGAQRAPQASLELGPLVVAAKAGDRRSWELLVTHFTPKLRSLGRGYRLREADVDDIVQETWTAALTHIDRIRVPDAFGGWLLVTARRASLRVIERNRREVVAIDEHVPTGVTARTPDSALLEHEDRIAVNTAVERLPERQSMIVRALLLDSGTSYADLADRLRIPLGSIGPTRERALARLRRELAPS